MTRVAKDARGRTKERVYRSLVKGAYLLLCCLELAAYARDYFAYRIVSRVEVRASDVLTVVPTVSEQCRCDFRLSRDSE